MQELNFYTEQLWPLLMEMQHKEKLKVSWDSDVFFSQLQGAFPVVGSKIAWDHVPGRVGNTTASGAVTVPERMSFFVSVRERYSLSGPSQYAGDSLVHFLVSADLEEMEALLPRVLDIPQHHYVAAPDASWCFAFTMEGDADFAFSPRRAGLTAATPPHTAS